MINLRSIRPLDRGTILASARKTHRVISVEEGWPQHGVGAEVAAVVQEHAFDDLDAPVMRITGGFLVWIPFSSLCFVWLFACLLWHWNGVLRHAVGLDWGGCGPANAVGVAWCVVRYYVVCTSLATHQFAVGG